MPSPLLVSRRALRAASALTLALGTGLAAPLFLTGTAGAATTSSATAAFSASDHAILYTAASGQTNKVTVTASMTSGSTQITYVIDDLVPISSGSGCTYPSSADRTKVSCTVETLESQDPYATLKLALGDGNDVVTYNNATDQAYYFASIDLGAGKDTHTDTGGVNGNDVDGGAGDDTLTAGGVTVARGGDGNDTIHAADGTIAQGGNGKDTIYSKGEDSAVDGGAGDDEIHGEADRQSLSGGDGNDTIYGGAGNDFLYGGKGNDVLYGNSGDDTIYGNSGDDELYGGPGNDTLSGGPGRNIVRQD
ncbi:calcium-binding protein [Streptomyces sp. NA02950]|uniref:calcium-binding protein n=1 Tax=Streptomyces sp. NA02950 TaxID=2742137 RepID=UPI00159082B6|nr:calcium-binding protein [Streptomyces sp. NA02950]QKV90753.1 calcium-binding protein [Streptomyces sp. NA02950]